MRESYSLREIGRQLDIPPSTISYYKDRFVRFIPVAGGRGRRVRYTAEAVVLFREIREMFTRNWSAEEVEERLFAMCQGVFGDVEAAAGDPASSASSANSVGSHGLIGSHGSHGQAGQAGSLGQAGQAGTAGLTGPLGSVFQADRSAGQRGSGGVSSPSGTAAFGSSSAAGAAADRQGFHSGVRPGQHTFVQELSGILDTMSSVLEVQSHLRAEVAALRGEVAHLRQERADLVRGYEERLTELDAELERFRRERADMVGQFLDDYYAATGSGHAASSVSGGHGGATVMPERALVEQPLVVRSGGEYLGVAGKGKPFSLHELIGLIRRNAGTQKVQGMDWQHAEGVWQLRILSQDDAGKGHEYRLEVVHTITPSKNAVTELRSMHVDGEQVPDKFVLMLFKNVKEGLER